MNPSALFPWSGKKVAFLGDSITDKIHVGTTKNYWQFLEEYLGIVPLVYGINGAQWDSIPEQARRLKAEADDTVDAILVFAGTNDYLSGIPLGEWWSVAPETVNYCGQTTRRPRRSMLLGKDTLRARINTAMRYLKSEFADQQIVLLTPIHRAFAEFGGDNIQPDETFCNNQGLHIEDYAGVVREAGSVWSAPVIDLFTLCGLYPLEPAHSKYFHDARTDLLHPNALGHRRIAKTIAAQLLALPPDFK